MITEANTQTFAPNNVTNVITKVNTLTTPRWHAPVGSALLVVTEMVFYLLMLVLILAAIMLNETMIIGILSDMHDRTLNIKSEEMEIIIVVHTVIKIMMAILAVFSLCIALLLRKWRRKNNLILHVYELTSA